MAAPASSSLKEYLKKYVSDPAEEKNKKKKKKAKHVAVAGGVHVVDEDPVWQKPVNFEQEEENDSPDEKPQVDEDIEFKRIKRLEQLRARRCYNEISEDGSGWVPISKGSDISNSDLSPPRQHRSKVLDADEDRDMSPPRRQSQGSPSPSVSPKLNDSPPRKRKSHKGIHNSAQERSTEADLSPQRTRPKTGLITGKDVSNEIAKTKKDEWSRFNQMDPSTSGRGAEPVYRFKGERVSKDEYLKLTKKKEDKPKEEKKLEWGKGLAQKREAEAKLLEMELEKEKPFARSRDDPELDQMMKDRVRWGDPMAHLVKKKQSDMLLSDLGENEKLKESGFIIPQDIPSHSWIKRGLDYEPNRYGIKPGRHWDGVNRSNGYEKQMFKRMNEKRATEREAYLWSVSDM